MIARQLSPPRRITRAFMVSLVSACALLPLVAHAQGVTGSLVATVADAAGTLTIEARAREAGGPIPIVFFATTGRYTSPQAGGPGSASVGVRAGERYRVFVGIPREAAALRYDVSASLR